MRNEFMAAWDGLRSKDTQRILILAATNRPFDLDDAVIRRLPRRLSRECFFYLIFIKSLIA
jgi:SpoVK/Ycf46/Vps4 family AAA+-type ATPase